MDDLTEFLNARLDEDEAMVAEPHIWPTTFRPERVLREVTVRQVIIEIWKDWPDYDLPPDVHDGRDDSERSRDEAIREALEAVVRAIATVYSDHPDYRPEWAPTPGGKR